MAKNTFPVQPNGGPAPGAFKKLPDTPQKCANAPGFPPESSKSSGIKIRGTGAATKGLMARGPMG